MYDSEQFYPTPAPLARKMWGQIASITRNKRSSILDPSAGNGDLLDAHASTPGDRIKRYAIEINPERRLVLAGKGYRVIGTDFLQYDDPMLFDAILMNPPFFQGVDHVLKAWDLVADGGRLVSLLNAETINNPHTRKRELLAHYVEQHGEIIELGAAFKTADRPTPIPIIMIILDKPQRERLGLLDDLDFDSDQRVRDIDEIEPSALAQGNIIESLVAQYQAAAELIKRQHQIRQEFKFYTTGVLQKTSDLYGDRQQKSLNDEITQLKSEFWRYIFDKTKIGAVTTSQVQRDVTERIKQQSQMAFTVENIMQILEAVIMNYDDVMQECIVQVFDQATAYHEKNKIHTEGWKTNKSWRVNEKIIIPRGITYDRKFGSWSLVWADTSFYTDLDKVLCYLDGKKYEDTALPYRYDRTDDDKPQRIQDAIEDHTRGKWGAHWQDVFESRYFRIKIHKKGTVHLWFKDEQLHAAFNRRAARGKNWLPADY